MEKLGFRLSNNDKHSAIINNLIDKINELVSEINRLNSLNYDDDDDEPNEVDWDNGEFYK